MSIQIYNTLSKRKEEFKPLEPGKVKMYVCGPTVYNLIHIGNARPMIVFDTVRRYMEYKGYEVNYVSNFTDVDDKIIKKANEEGVEPSVISERYIAECKKDMEGMNIEPATKNPKATEEIGGMLDMIQTLIDKGHAYPAADGTVYFRTRSFKGYGKLSHKNLDDLQGGNRSLLVSGEDQKEDPLDFVLWKPKKEGEPYWDSCWCQGRPGWHIECSVMSKRYLGEEIDIHAGGEDLIFPHHENEIAQSEAANDKPFAKYWMHNAFLNIDNRKMSKSLGNFRTVREISEQYDLQVLRFFMLSAHYRSPLNFSAELMEASIVDIPANSNAVRLYDRSTSVLLAAGMDTNSVPALSTTSFKNKMTLKESWSAFLSFLNISQDKAVTTELSAENLDSLHNEFTRLKSDNSSLVQAKQEIDQKLSDATTEIATLKTTVSEKDQEIANLKTEASGKDSEITQLKEQVANLKKAPAPGEPAPAPKGEPAANGGKEELAAYCEENASNYQGITERLKADGLL